MMYEPGMQDRLFQMRRTYWGETESIVLAKALGVKASQVRPVVLAPTYTPSDELEIKLSADAIALSERLTTKNEQRFWDGIFPSLSRHIISAYARTHRMPYCLQGMTVLPFRAPEHEATIKAQRGMFLLNLMRDLRGLDLTPESLAAWSAHIGFASHAASIGQVLAAIVSCDDSDSETVRGVLRDSILGEHPTGRAAPVTIGALLHSADPADITLIEKLLLSTKRQEGFRETLILSFTFAPPDVLRRMLGLIVEHNLSRFSSTVEAYNYWFNAQWHASSSKVVHEGFERAVRYLEDEQARDSAIAAGEADEAYTAMWALATTDAAAAAAHARTLLDSGSVEHRWIAATMLHSLMLYPESDSGLSDRLTSGEPDPRIRAILIEALTDLNLEPAAPGLFDTLEGLYKTAPKRRRKHDPVLWPWTETAEDRRSIVTLMLYTAESEPTRMLPYADSLDADNLRDFVRTVVRAETSRMDLYSIIRPDEAKGDVYEFLLRLLQAPSAAASSIAFQALANTPVTEAEAKTLISKLTRSGAEFRKGAIGRLMKLDDDAALGAAEALLNAKSAKQKAAGIEIAQELAKAGRKREAALALVEAHRESLEGTELEKQAANSPTDEKTRTDSAAGYFGLLRADRLTRLPEAEFRGIRFDTPGARACVRRIGELYLQHAETQVTYRPFEGQRTEILSEIGWQFPRPKFIDDPRTEALREMPLAEVWLDWLDNRGDEERDPDGLELLRASQWPWLGEDLQQLLQCPSISRDLTFAHTGVRAILDWIFAIEAPKGSARFVLEMLEDTLSEDRPSKKDAPEELKATCSILKITAAEIASRVFESPVIEWNEEEKCRYALLNMIRMRNGAGQDRTAPPLKAFVVAYDHGKLNDDDFIYYLLTRSRKRPTQSPYYYRESAELGECTALRPPPELASRPKLLEIIRRVRDRVVEIELARGELVGEATQAASNLASSGGASTLFKLAAALGKDSMVRTYQWGEPTRKYSFSRLIRISWLEQGDTPERFAELQQQHKLSRKRLLEIAVFAPQWARCIEHTLQIPGLEEAVWWIHAHTKGSGDWSESDLRDRWASLIAERTPVEAEALEEGAVDVAWFGRMFEAVGRERWDELQRPARFASSSGGHKRAQLFASALLGETPAADLEERIEHNRDKAAVMALGLVPLPAEHEAAKAESLRRYGVIQEFKRQSNQFGMQRRASEGRAVAIAMQNLARTGGHRDPQHLEWAMEAEAVRDLAAGPVSVTEGEVTVTLSIDDEGAPELAITKNGKPLKAVPAKLRKHEQISTLRSRVTDLRKQKTRMRRSLEEAMCRGDSFTPEQLRELSAHPVLRPMLERLVLVGGDGGGDGGDLIGYPAEGGRVLRNHDGALEPVGKNDTLRLAHAMDLFRRGDWSQWQRDCLCAERVQPFKQIFREIYPPTEAELAEEGMVNRYAGHQVQPAKMMALLKGRGWIASHEEGLRRVFLDEGVIAELWAENTAFTPGWVEDPTLSGVRFVGRKDYETIPASKVPPRVFSETMRDIDLVVSVAHAGGVDPEASASTVEMRASLLRETAAMLGLGNITVEDRYAFIDGSRARYALHLGSANTSIPPGRSLVIVAIHSQHRGRLFLPFADDDPKTAEVMSKALLLARDEAIKDPSILAQIKA